MAEMPEEEVRALQPRPKKYSPEIKKAFIQKFFTEDEQKDLIVKYQGWAPEDVVSDLESQGLSKFWEEAQLIGQQPAERDIVQQLEHAKTQKALADYIPDIDENERLRIDGEYQQAQEFADQMVGRAQQASLENSLYSAEEGALGLQAEAAFMEVGGNFLRALRPLSKTKVGTRAADIIARTVGEMGGYTTAEIMMADWQDRDIDVQQLISDLGMVGFLSTVTHGALSARDARVAKNFDNAVDSLVTGYKPSTKTLNKFMMGENTAEQTIAETLVRTNVYHNTKTIKEVVKNTQSAIATSGNRLTELAQTISKQDGTSVSWKKFTDWVNNVVAESTGRAKFVKQGNLASKAIRREVENLKEIAAAAQLHPEVFAKQGSDAAVSLMKRNLKTKGAAARAILKEEQKYKSVAKGIGAEVRGEDWNKFVARKNRLVGNYERYKQVVESPNISFENLTGIKKDFDNQAYSFYKKNLKGEGPIHKAEQSKVIADAARGAARQVAEGAGEAGKAWLEENKTYGLLQRFKAIIGPAEARVTKTPRKHLVAKGMERKTELFEGVTRTERLHQRAMKELEKADLLAQPSRVSSVVDLGKGTGTRALIKVGAAKTLSPWSKKLALYGEEAAQDWVDAFAHKVAADANTTPEEMPQEELAGIAEQAKGIFKEYKRTVDKFGIDSQEALEFRSNLSAQYPDIQELKSGVPGETRLSNGKVILPTPDLQNRYIEELERRDIPEDKKVLMQNAAAKGEVIDMPKDIKPSSIKPKGSSEALK